MSTQNLVNIGSGYILLPDGTMTLPEPMLTYHQFNGIQLRAILLGMLKISITQICCEITNFKISRISPRRQWVKSINTWDQNDGDNENNNIKVHCCVMFWCCLMVAINHQGSLSVRILQCHWGNHEEYGKKNLMNELRIIMKTNIKSQKMNLYFLGYTIHDGFTETVL